MQQVLFHVPFTTGLLPPDGLPVFGFGVMLFFTFLLVATIWGPRRAALVGLSRDRLQDLAIVLFLTGIAGARVVYMVQYSDQFPDRTPLGLVAAFFQIWNGGIVLYGSIIGGFLGYLAFYRIVLRKIHVSGWKMADVAAPLLALGIAIGRIGCFLNGCCWGQVVCEECQPVPISARLGQFPLLPAHSRDQVCKPATDRDRLPWVRGLQTSTGFTQRREVDSPSDPREIVAIEPGSAAQRIGLKPKDLVITANGVPNRLILELSGSPEELTAAVKRAGGTRISQPDDEKTTGVVRVAFENLDGYDVAVAAITPLRTVRMGVHDTLWEQVADWRDQRKGVNELSLVVRRDGTELPFAFTPRTVSFYPTQVYETVSMLLLMLLLLAFQPFRRHDGQVMVLWMLGYAVHRFFNEAIRIEPTYAMGLTLSQWISVGIFAAGVALELYLRWAMSPLPPGPLPLSYGVEKPTTETPSATT